MSDNRCFKHFYELKIFIFKLWASLEAEIIPQECEIYSYNPDSPPEEEVSAVFLAQHLNIEK